MSESSNEPLTNIADDGPMAEHMDVWSRSGTKYRLRAVILLAANVLLFCGVACFAFWVRNGIWFAPAWDGYWDEIRQTLSFGRQTTVTLVDFLSAPISVLDVPMQIPIIGLLMATLFAIPILVSILYRFQASVPFILAVGFLAVMPWLAITLLGSCIIASLRPFRSRFRFMSAIAGLVPTVIYLILAWHGTEEAVMGRFDPVDRIKFIAPWVLAIVAATVVFAVVLSIAKIVDYRPGAIAPLLALMFGLPLGLFEFQVGRDELHYRLLDAVNNHHFQDKDAAIGLREAAQRAWERHPKPRPPREDLMQIEQQKWQFELASDPGAAVNELANHRWDFIHRCDWFLSRFPTSRYVLNVLFLKARSLDMRVDAVAFRESKWIRYYEDFPCQASADTWRVVAKNGPGTLAGSVANLRLAQLTAREGDVDRAIALLDQLLRNLPWDRVTHLEGTQGRKEDKGVMERAVPSASLSVTPKRVWVQACRLRDLLRENQDPIHYYEPLCGSRDASASRGLLDLEVRSEHYIANLQQLKSRFPNCQIEDNIDLEIAKSTRLVVNDQESPGRAARRPTKIELLESCLQRFPHRDAAPEAMFRLAIAYRSVGRSRESDEAFERLLSDHRDSVWARQVVDYVHAPRHATRADKGNPNG